ncbi:MAG: esterase [Lachnospiraceae bacterium]|nr:esterase [Lachnospiraceae bacterium]
MRTEFIIGEKHCFLYKIGNGQQIPRCLIQAIDAHDLEVLDREVERIQELTGNASFLFAAFLIKDWNRELSPWQALAVFGKKPFGSGAKETLTFVIETLIPELKKRYGSNETLECYLGGYSLSGLFALWSGYQTDVFAGIAGVSPSVWFPGWEDFIRSHTMQSPLVYLSLGDREERTRNQVMARVGTAIRKQQEIFMETNEVQESILEWNPGNHFVDSELRMAKGFAWLLNR